MFGKTQTMGDDLDAIPIFEGRDAEQIRAQQDAMIESVMSAAQDREEEAEGARSGKRDKEKVDPDAVKKGVTDEEHLTARCHIRQLAAENKKCKREIVGDAQPGSKDYRLAMKQYRSEALERVNFILKNATELLPDAVILGMKWFDKQDEQFFDLYHLYGNLDSLGNMVVQFHDFCKTAADFGPNAKYAKLIDLTVKSLYKWDEKGRPMVLAAGPASTAKSFTLEFHANLLPPGVVRTNTHETALACTSSQDENLKLTVMDETPPDMIRSGTGPNGKPMEGSRGASVRKSMLTNKIVTTQQLTVSDGIRRKLRYIASMIGTGIYATNEKLPPSTDPCWRATSC